LVRNPQVWAWFSSRDALWAGRVDVALRLAEEAQQASEETIQSRLFGRWNRAHALATKGEYEASLVLLDETLAMCERVGDAIVSPRCLNMVGWVYAELQDFERAMEWNRRALDAVGDVRAPMPEVEMQTLLNVAENLHALGRLGEAEERFGEVERVVRDPQVMEWMRWRYAQRFLHSSGELWLARGDTSRALACADECRARVERSGSRKNIAKARRLRGQALAVQGRLEEAEVELTAALELAAEVGNPPQLWRTHVALGDLCSAQGQPEDARRAYASALAVIDKLAAGLTDESLRATFLASDHVQGIRDAAESPA
jgi:tetratricopeptide (TPR) repeat protein